MAEYEWKPGQKVMTWRGSVFRTREILTIDSVTKSGIAKIGSALFNKNGRERGGGLRGLSIVPATDKDIDEINAEREHAQRVADVFSAWNPRKVRDMTVERLRELHRLLTED